MRKNRVISQQGFTLIELMVTVAIVVILTMIAFPNYQSYLISSKRAEAQSHLFAIAQYLESQYNASFQYPQPDNIPSQLTTPQHLATHYVFEVDSTSGQNFTIKATPTSRQKDSLCGVLTLDSKGDKTPKVEGCWK